MSTNSYKRERDKFGFIDLAPRPLKNKTNYKDKQEVYLNCPQRGQSR